VLEVLNGRLETEFAGIRERMAKNCGIVFAAGSKREHSCECERIRRFKSQGCQKRSAQTE
jgi:hypothetical protein